MAYKIKKQKVNRKFLYTAIKAQQTKLNELFALVNESRKQLAILGEEAGAMAQEFKVVIAERDTYLKVIEGLGINVKPFQDKVTKARPLPMGLVPSIPELTSEVRRTGYAHRIESVGGGSVSTNPKQTGRAYPIE